MLGNFFEIIIFAAVTVFLVIKLISVLGKEDMEDEARRKNKKLAASMDNNNEVKIVEPIIINSKENDEEELKKQFGDDLADKIKKIQNIDAQFDPKDFLQGAEKAFEYIIKNFAAGNKESLKPLLSKEIFANFCKVIDNNLANNYKQNTIIVSLKKPSIKTINLIGSKAEIVVDIISEQINYVSDKDAKIIDGDHEQIDKIEDLWTLSRDLKSSDPNWILIKTDYI